jgi:ribosomal protein L36
MKFAMKLPEQLGKSKRYKIDYPYKIRILNIVDGIIIIYERQDHCKLTRRHVSIMIFNRANSKYLEIYMTNVYCIKSELKKTLSDMYFYYNYDGHSYRNGFVRNIYSNNLENPPRYIVKIACLFQGFFRQQNPPKIVRG